ncbi:asparagine synthase [Clostridium sp. DJ247]|uniref:asparagine synthase n=1 Tax=Clostridium sp. DJ247 TaxID=2726188 RepID=UPI001A9BD6D5|nr:asparagine synthase [Clostridium sp. DJ247]MBC2581125.1 asparagine synthase [Clostridium sp. DJ247]
MREGIVPTVLGAAVTVGAAALRSRDIKRRGLRTRNVLPMIETAVLGFGLAHVVLGGIDLIEHRR